MQVNPHHFQKASAIRTPAAAGYGDSLSRPQPLLHKLVSKANEQLHTGLRQQPSRLRLHTGRQMEQLVLDVVKGVTHIVQRAALRKGVGRVRQLSPQLPTNVEHARQPHRP